MKKGLLGVAVIAAAACTGGDDDGGTGIRGQIAAGVSVSGVFGTEFGASAVWVPVTLPIDLSPFDQPDGGCTSLTGGAPVEALPLDAGASLTMDGPNGDLTLTSIIVQGFYAGGTDGNAYYVPGGTYTFSGTGGPNIGAFSQSLSAPSALTVTAPDLSPTTVTISKSADLAVAWTTSGGTDPVFVTLTQYDSDTETEMSVVCRFDDDGSGTVPASELAAFELDNAFVLKTTLAVETLRYSLFEIPGGGTTLGTMSFRWEADLEVQ